MTPHVEFERARLRLRLGAPVRFRAPNHGAVLSGLVRAALGPHELPPGLLPFACESGRMDFAAGDEYAFALTLAGAAAGLLDGLAAGLEAVGRSAPAGDAERCWPVGVVRRCAVVAPRLSDPWPKVFPPAGENAPVPGSCPETR